VLKIGTATAAAGAARTTLSVVVCGTFVLMLAGGLAGLVLRLKPRALATFVHVTFRGNLAYIGLPVIYFAFSGTEYEAEAESVAALTLGIIVVLYNVVAVLIHLLSTHRVNMDALKRVFIKLLGNPLLLACVVGLVWNHWFNANGVAMPVLLHRTLSMLGQFALPMALLCVGGALATTPVREIASGALVSAGIKTMLGPAAGFVFARLLGAGPMETGVACLLLGAPTAVASFVLTEQLDGKPQLAAAAIVVSTLLSAATFAVTIAFIR
jgi:predicted permease